MSNVTHITATESAQHAQAAHLWGLLEAERWTFRKLEAHTGMKVGVISSRMRGVTPLTIGEVETFAGVLRRDPVELYRELLSCTSSPSPESSNHRTLVP